MNLTEKSKEVGKVYYTKELSKFKRIETNRPIEPRVQKIIDSMKKDGLMYCPIMVNPQGYVLDGEHRIYSARKVGCGIYFTINYDVQTLEECERYMISYNKLVNKWGKFQFLGHYVKRNLQSYVTLEKFIEEFPTFSVTDCVMLLNNNSNYPGTDDFEQGKWVHQNVDIGRKWGNFILEIQKYFPEGGRALFIRSMINILNKVENFSLDQFLYKCSLVPHQLSVQADRKSYYRMIEDVYNYKQKGNTKLYIRI